MKIYLIRHGESTGDIENRYGGTYNDHLTEKGLQGARESAEKFQNLGIQVVYSSPYFRAKEAAEIFNTRLGCKLEIIAELREWNRYGFLSGMDKEEAKEKYPEQVKLIGNYETHVKDCEPYDSLKNRAISALEKIAHSNNSAVLVLLHGGILRCLARELLGIQEIKNYVDYAFMKVEYAQGAFKVIKIEGFEI